VSDIDDDTRDAIECIAVVVELVSMCCPTKDGSTLVRMTRVDASGALNTDAVSLPPPRCHPFFCDRPFHPQLDTPLPDNTSTRRLPLPNHEGVTKEALHPCKCGDPLSPSSSASQPIAQQRPWPFKTSPPIFFLTQMTRSRLPRRPSSTQLNSTQPATEDESAFNKGLVLGWYTDALAEHQLTSS